MSLHTAEVAISPRRPGEILNKLATPLLGQAAGVYFERPAPPALQAHFSRTWWHTVPVERAHGTLVVPDGCTDLLCIDGALRVAGPDRKAKLERVPPGTTVVGFRFQPGVAAAWLRVPMSDIVGARPLLASFWGDEVRSLGEWAAEAATAAGVAQRLESALAARVPRMTRMNETAQKIFHCLDGSRQSDARIVSYLSRQLGMSDRTLRRRCHEAFGYGPKTLHRILRFQRYLQMAESRTDAAAADLAMDAGYADQPHLIRETRELAGLTPRELVAQLAHRP
jgi:AraC-like DNA-binding protein